MVAALERFMRDTVPLAASAPPRRNAWLQAALQEGVDRAPSRPLPWA